MLFDYDGFFCAIEFCSPIPHGNLIIAYSCGLYFCFANLTHLGLVFYKGRNQCVGQDEGQANKGGEKAP